MSLFPDHIQPNFTTTVDYERVGVQPHMIHGNIRTNEYHSIEVFIAGRAIINGKPYTFQEMVVVPLSADSRTDPP